jgi:superoxide dismutase
MKKLCKAAKAAKTAKVCKTAKTAKVCKAAKAAKATKVCKTARCLKNQMTGVLKMIKDQSVRKKTIFELKQELIKEFASLPKFKIALAESTTEGRMGFIAAQLLVAIAEKIEGWEADEVANYEGYPL